MGDPYILKQLVRRTGDLIDATSKGETAEVAIDVVEDVLDAPLAGVHLLSDDGGRLEAVAALDQVRMEFEVPPAYDRSEDAPDAELVWSTFESGEPSISATSASARTWPR